MYKTLLIGFFITISISVFAQKMNLDDCINYAFENNPSLLNKKIDRSIALETYRQSKRDLLPSLDAGSSGNMFFGKSIDPGTNSFVNEKLFSTNFALSAQLDLFSGFMKQNRIAYERINYMMSKEDFRQMELDMSFQIMNSFYDFIYYNDLYDIVKRQVEITKLNLTKTEKLIELGLKSNSDLLEMKAQEATEQHNLINIQNKKEKSMLSLKKLMNYPLNSELYVSNDVFGVSDKIFLVDEVYSAAIANMPLVKKSELDVNLNKKNISIARGRYYPSISLGASYSTNFVDNKKERINPGDPNSGLRLITFSDQFSQNASQSVFLRISIPIFYKWRNRSSVKMAKYKLQKAENRKIEVYRKLYAQVAEDCQQINSLKKEYKQLLIKRDALKEAYKIAEKKLMKGMISVLEFYTAKNQLANSEVDLLRTKTMFKIKEKTIEKYY